MKKTCLITGGNGFIGTNLAEYLKKHADWQIITTGREEYKNVPAQPHYIINLASESHVEKSIKQPSGVIYNNVCSTLDVLEFARANKPEVFIQFSTDEVYGSKKHNEWDIMLPSNPYSASKAAQEMIAISYWKTYKIPVVILSSGNVFGPGQSSANFIPKLVEYICKGQEVPIYTINGKPGKRCWNPVENVCAAIEFILRVTPATYPESDRPDKYSLPGGLELDNLQVAKTIAVKLDKPLKYKLIDAEDVRPGYDEFYAKTPSTLEKIGWEPPVSFWEGLSWL